MMVLWLVDQFDDLELTDDALRLIDPSTGTVAATWDRSAILTRPVRPSTEAVVFSTDYGVSWSKLEVDGGAGSNAVAVGNVVVTLVRASSGDEFAPRLRRLELE